MKVNVIQIFSECLEANREDIVIQGLMGLGNIAGNDAHCRDQILIPSIIDKICMIKEQTTEDYQQVHCWFISNLLNFKPIPGDSLTQKLIPVLTLFYNTGNEDMVANAS